MRGALSHTCQLSALTFPSSKGESSWFSLLGHSASKTDILERKKEQFLSSHLNMDQVFGFFFSKNELEERILKKKKVVSPNPQNIILTTTFSHISNIKVEK